MIDMAVLESGTFVERVLMLDEIEKSGDGKHIEPLAALMAGSELDESLRQALSDTLRSLFARNPEAVADHVKAAKTPAAKIAIQLAGQLKIESAREALKEAIGGGLEAEGLLEALSSLGQVADGSTRDIFSKFSNHSDPFISAVCIRQLGALGDAGSLQFLKGILAEAESEGSYRDCSLPTAAAVDALADLGSDEALGALVGKIHHRNPTVRRLIHQVLIGRGEKVVGSIGRFFEHGDTDEKIMAAGLLGQIGSPRGAELMLSAIDRGWMDDANVRFAVFEAFGSMPSLKTMICLVDALTETDEMTLVAVVSSLSRIINPGVIARVAGALGKGDGQAKKVAAAIASSCSTELFKAVYQDQAASGIVVEQLKAVKDPRTREVFVEALREIGGERAERDAAALGGAAGEAKKKRILAVDDSRSILMFYRAALSDMGFEVATAENGKVALDLLSYDTGFDMIITDMNMPEMNGIELTRKIRENMFIEAIPVIMATTESDSSQMELAGQAGVTGYLVKPIKPDSLKTVIAQTIGTA